MPALPLLDDALVDGTVTVTDDDAIEGARRLARTEGILAGFSSGACLVAAEKLVRERHPGATAASSSAPRRRRGRQRPTSAAAG